MFTSCEHDDIFTIMDVVQSVSCARSYPVCISAKKAVSMKDFHPSNYNPYKTNTRTVNQPILPAKQYFVLFWFRDFSYAGTSITFKSWKL